MINRRAENSKFKLQKVSTSFKQRFILNFEGIHSWHKICVLKLELIENVCFIKNQLSKTENLTCDN